MLDRPWKIERDSGGPNLPTNRTVSYKVYIGCCSVKHKRSGILLYSPARFKESRPILLRQQKIMLAHRPSPGQPITTNNKKLGSV